MKRGTQRKSNPRLNYSIKISDMNYSLLLRLYHGDAAVVELLSKEARAALEIETPLFRFIEEVTRASTPRHVFLTGNAGDGKTFTAMQVFTARDGVCVVHDASELYAEASDPIDALATHLEAALNRDERIFMSINRGQLERLHDAQLGRSGALDELIRQAYEQLHLNVSWETRTSSVAVIDLGLLDTLSPLVLSPMLDKLQRARAVNDMAAPTRRAFEAAKEALGDERVRARVVRALTLIRGAGHHVTMRQLWSTLSFMLTGGREPLDDTPLTLEDALGARLYSEVAEGDLFELLRREDDPSTAPQPELDHAALVSATLRAELAACPGLSFLGDEPPLRGRALNRVAAVHRWPRARAVMRPKPVFDRLVDDLRAMGPGWHRSEKLPTELLLKGIYASLGLWSSSNARPVWEWLCYDSRRLDGATAVANAELDSREVGLGLPRPNPAAQRALEGSWRPPYIWMIYGEDEPRLRLTPTLVEALAVRGSDRAISAAALSEAEQLRLWRWLSHVGGRGQRRDGHLRLFRPGDNEPLELTSDWTTEKLSLG